jgi:molybdenum cofactor guanylyltransferase
MTRRDTVAGIFVGGRGTRMGGVAKGLLETPEREPIILRTRRLLEAAGARCVLVGVHSAYADLRMRVLEDDASAKGPLAGLLALLRYAGDGQALAIACDMPLIAPELLQRLILAKPAPIVAPRRQVWEPLFARYDAPAVLPIAKSLASRGIFKLQTLMEESGAVALPFSREEEASLVDWDIPADVTKSR